MWSCCDSSDNCRQLLSIYESIVIFPSAFYRWAEETAVLDGESVHDLILIFKEHIIEILMARLKADIEKRQVIRDERKKIEKEKIEKSKDKTEGVAVQVNLIVEENHTEETSNAPTPAPITPENQTPGTPANTPR